ncbi:MAG: hypothetical protein A2Y65_01270 [Deltaproteobacteria bacterium RBG_13_52_11]|nr:MAG: hypothetical protein A2Y65_01270 [Deltaproteobacteria bacterium RBG_13_52_11]
MDKNNSRFDDLSKENKERHKKIAGTLRSIGIKDFLIVGLRKTSECGTDQLEGFSVFNTEMNAAIFIATLHEILKDDQNTITLFKKILEQKAQDRGPTLNNLIFCREGTA